MTKEEKKRKILKKASIPPYLKKGSSNLVPFGKDKKGNPRTLDLSYILPYHNPSKIERFGKAIKSDIGSAGSFLKKTGKEFAKQVGGGGQNLLGGAGVGFGIMTVAKKLEDRKKKQ